jgi:hypothetical protein
MSRYVIRLDVEIEAKNQDNAGKEINYLIETAYNIKGLKHFQWALVGGQLDDPDLEKNILMARLQEVQPQ